MASENLQPIGSDADVTFHRDGALLIVSLNRAGAYNAITYEMRQAMSGALPDIGADPEIYAVAIQSNFEKAFSAGADVREIADCARADIGKARRGFKEEYTLNWQLDCFTKPTVSLINGMVIGSGVGISAYGTHRVAGERYRFSMPETAIGLFPDVGVASILGKMPDEIGIYLGLSGARVERADAFDLGLATHCIGGEHFDAIKSELSDAQPIDVVLDERHSAPGPGVLEPLRETIAHCFSGDSVEEIIGRLSGVAGRNRDWAVELAADLAKRSPLSLKVTLQHLRWARDMTLKDVLEVDYRLACRFLDGADFYEGVRAALVVKDGKPVWRPASLEEVSDDMVAAYFSTMGGDELVLAGRRDAQALPR